MLLRVTLVIKQDVVNGRKSVNTDLLLQVSTDCKKAKESLKFCAINHASQAVWHMALNTNPKP